MTQTIDARRSVPTLGVAAASGVLLTTMYVTALGIAAFEVWRVVEPGARYVGLLHW